MNPSERIRAALERSDTTRHSDVTEQYSPPAEVERTLPLLGTSDEDRVDLPEEDIVQEDDDRRAHYTTVRTSASSSAAAVASTRPTFPLLYVVLGVVLVGTGVAAFLLKDRLFRSGAGADSAHALKMQVESAANGQIGIRWDPQSPAVAKAVAGRMQILEQGQQARTAALTPEQLATGHLYYRSSANQVEFRLEVVANGGGTVRESILAISSTPGVPAATQPPVEVSQKAPPQPKSVASNTTPAAKVEPPPAVKAPEPAPPQTRLAARTFTPPPLRAEQKIDEASAVLLDASTALPGATVITPVLVLSDLKAPPPPDTKTAQTTSHPLKVGGNVQAANLVKRVAPVYPPLAKTARVQGTVRFTAVIGKNGRVQNVQFISGPQMLSEAGKAAVKQWVYKPLLLNGAPMDVVTQIDVVFSLAP